MDDDAAHDPAIAELHRTLAELAYAMAGPRAHTRLRSQAGVSVDRASLALLRTLARSPEPLRMGALAEALMVRPSHVSREVRRMRELGLVTYSSEAGDQRVRRITVTENGRELVARAGETGQQWLREALPDFSPADLAVTTAVIRRVVDLYRAE